MILPSSSVPVPTKLTASSWAWKSGFISIIYAIGLENTTSSNVWLGDQVPKLSFTWKVILCTPTVRLSADIDVEFSLPITP